MLLRCCLALIALSLALPVRANDWLRAESEHYIVHAEMDEAELRRLMQTLEDFGTMLDRILPGETEPGQKLALYLAPNASRVSRVTNFRVSGLAAGGAEQPIAYATYDFATVSRYRAESVFFYLAGYHLAFKFFRPKPPWLRSGFGAFFSDVWRDEEGAFVLGQPGPGAQRSRAISSVDLEFVLTTNAFPRQQAPFERFYESSAALTAILLSDPAQREPLLRYLDAYVSGVSMAEAMPMLGARDALAKAIILRSRARALPIRRVGLAPRPPAAVTITAMTPDAIALVEPRIERLLDERREAVSAKLAALTERFPGSADVWFEYGAAEFARVQAADFGGVPLLRGFGFANGELIVTANRHSDAEAWRAATHALELDPDHAQARRLKAEIMLGRLVRARDEPAAEEWDAVRALLEPLAAEPARHPLAAALAYQSYIEQGLPAPDRAIERLGRAFIANTGVADFRYAYAVALARAGKVSDARMLLTAMRNDPEFGEAAARALEEAP